jgi:hypothetical protein
MRIHDVWTTCRASNKKMGSRLVSATIIRQAIDQPAGRAVALLCGTAFPE